LADKLEALGMVQRRECAEDRRLTIIQITDCGLEALERAQQAGVQPAAARAEEVAA
jgi:DNA-binding MarR family transcriptional regulator